MFQLGATSCGEMRVSPEGKPDRSRGEASWNGQRILAENDMPDGQEL